MVTCFASYDCSDYSLKRLSEVYGGQAWAVAELQAEETDLDELRAHLLRWDCLQLSKLALIAHGPHQREAVTIGEQILDRLSYLQRSP